mmetsp:Transcript_52173/g.156589  ORF Transcript_52173/g.156589 Transcript_52173/m.156589 type:complete len:266 (+) Transcript_52173:1550-2347(+)
MSKVLPHIQTGHELQTSRNEALADYNLRILEGSFSRYIKQVVRTHRGARKKRRWKGCRFSAPPVYAQHITRLPPLEVIGQKWQDSARKDIARSVRWCTNQNLGTGVPSEDLDNRLADGQRFSGTRWPKNYVWCTLVPCVHDISDSLLLHFVKRTCPLVDLNIVLLFLFVLFLRFAAIGVGGRNDPAQMRLVYPIAGAVTEDGPRDIKAPAAQETEAEVEPADVLVVVPDFSCSQSLRQSLRVGLGGQRRILQERSSVNHVIVRSQ